MKSESGFSLAMTSQPFRGMLQNMTWHDLIELSRWHDEVTIKRHQPVLFHIIFRNG